MIAHWPGRIAAGSVSDHPSAFWDIMPTLAHLIGARVPHHSDGISFLPTLLGMVEDQVDHAYLYWEYLSRGGSQAVRMGDWKGIRTGIVGDSGAPIQLYQLRDDISEQNNVADAYPEIVAQIKRVMQMRTPSHIEKWNFEFY